MIPHDDGKMNSFVCRLTRLSIAFSTVLGCPSMLAARMSVNVAGFGDVTTGDCGTSGDFLGFVHKMSMRYDASRSFSGTSLVNDSLACRTRLRLVYVVIPLFKVQPHYTNKRWTLF